MSEFEIVKSEYNALGEDNNYKTHYFKTSADQVVGLGRMKSFSYAVGDVVYIDNNMQVALKCVTAGTTSNTELDISNKVVSESVEDGSVVWKVIARDTLNALPLSGGVLTNAITWHSQDTSDDNFARINSSKSSNTFYMETYSKGVSGARIALRNQQHQNAGGFEIEAKNSEGSKKLKGNPNGDLTWNNETIAGFIHRVGCNGYYRGKNLGTIASVADADAFNTAHGLSAGTFDDIFVGDEITIKDGTYNAVWLVAGIDWDYNKGDTASGHGILLIPKTPLYNDQMNSTNVTTGGYKGSAMHTTKLPALVTKLQTVLGSHLKKRRVLLSNSVNTSIASMAGADWKGATNGWEWADAYAVLPSEVEVYGSTVFSSSFYDVGEANQRLPIFNFINPVYFSHWPFWLRAVASSPCFCLVNNNGTANYGNASYSNGVRPLIYLA